MPSPPLHEVFLEAYRLEVQFLGRVGKIAPLTRPLAGFTGVFLPGGFSKELCTGRLRADFQPLTLKIYHSGVKIGTLLYTCTSSKILPLFYTHGKRDSYSLTDNLFS